MADERGFESGGCEECGRVPVRWRCETLACSIGDEGPMELCDACKPRHELECATGTITEIDDEPDFSCVYD